MIELQLVQATKHNTTPGTCIKVASGIPCLTPWTFRTVYSDECGMFIRCKDGQHYLKDLMSEAGEFVGLFIG